MKVNAEGVTWLEWRQAVGVYAPVGSKLHRAWLAGEDPTEWRKHVDNLQHKVFACIHEHSHDRTMWYEALSALKIGRQGLPLRTSMYSALFTYRGIHCNALCSVVHRVMAQLIQDDHI